MFTVTLEEGAVVVRRTNSTQPMTSTDTELIDSVLQLANRTRAATENASYRPPARRSPDYQPDELVVAVAEKQVRAGWPNNKLAGLLGVHPSMLSHYRSGRSRISFDVLRSWAYLVGLDILLVPWAWRGMVRQLLKDLREVEVMQFESKNKL